ncbi:MAG: Gfo/Idh/MocA family oxidoreductase [Pseudomonadota bacterium]
MTPPLRVGCVGAGYFARFHYDAWARIPGAAPVAAVDLDRARARATGLAAYNDLDAMLKAETPDILDIILPPDHHMASICSGIAHDVRAIICQKPFCRDLAEADQAIAIAREAEIPIIVHENFRFQPWYRIMRDAMTSGAIGEVHQVTFRLRTGDGQGPEAYLDRQPYFQTMPRLLIHETGVHWIDTFRYLLGDPDSVYADLRRMNPAIAGEDAGHMLFTYADGRRALFDGNRLLDHAAENHRLTLGEALVEGTGGTLTLSGDGSVTLRPFRSLGIETLLPAQDWRGFAGDCVHALQSHVVSALLEGTPLENTAEDYRRVLELEAAVYASDRTGKRIRV